MKKVIFLINVIAIMCLNLVSYADNQKVEILTNKTALQNEDETEISIKLLNTDNELYTYSGEIQYDKDIFEEITSNNFSSLNSWENLQYNSSNNKFIITKNCSIGNEEILKVKLKCKNNAKNSSTKIYVKNLKTVNEASNEEVETLSEKGININIKDSNSDKNIFNNANNNENGEKQQNDNLANKKLPQAGDKKSISIFIIAIALLYTICIFVRYKKINKKFIVLLIVFSLTNNIYVNATQTSSNTQKGDINFDGKINNEDIQLLEKYLIGLENFADEQKTNSDIYEDNKINLVDLHYLVKKINNNQIGDNTNNKYNFEQITP